MTATRGLSDNQVTVLALIFGIFFAVQTSLQGLPQDEKPPSWVFNAIGIIGAAVLVVKAQLGIRDATTAAVAVTAERTAEIGLKQNRIPSKDQVKG